MLGIITKPEGFNHIPSKEAVPQWFILLYQTWAWIREHLGQQLCDVLPLWFNITLQLYMYVNNKITIRYNILCKCRNFCCLQLSFSYTFFISALCGFLQQQLFIQFFLKDFKWLDWQWFQLDLNKTSTCANWIPLAKSKKSIIRGVRTWVSSFLKH